MVDQVQRDLGPGAAAPVGVEHPDCIEHPGDVEPLRRAVAALLGDVAGLGLAAGVAITGVNPVPLELAALVSAVEFQPRLRRVAESALGQQGADLGLAWLSAFTHGLAQGPAGLAVDVAYRASMLTEAEARRQVWIRREHEFYANPRRRPVEAPILPDRPVPLPRGAVGTWAARLSIAALVGFGGALLATGDPRRASDAFLSGTPKAARVGREGFAAQLGRTLSARGVVPVDPRALRRLDRLDTVVIDAAAITAGGWRVDTVCDLDGGLRPRLQPIAEALLDARNPANPSTDGTWRLSPLDGPALEVTPAVRSRAKRLRTDGALSLTLARQGRVEALVRCVARLDPAAHELAAAVRAAGHRLVVAGRKGAAGTQLGAAQVCPRGTRLGACVRDLQRGGAVVAVITRRGRAALVAADVGIGLTRPSGRPPWGADLLCGRELSDAIFIIRASTTARAVSRRSAWLALVGSAGGAAAALAGPPGGAMHRSAFALNGAAALALSDGTQSGRSLGRRWAAVAADAPEATRRIGQPRSAAARLGLPRSAARLSMTAASLAVATTATSLRLAERTLLVAADVVAPRTRGEPTPGEPTPGEPFIAPSNGQSPAASGVD